MTLHDRVAKILSSLDDSDVSLAKRLGVNRNTISAYRKGTGDLKGIALESLAQNFGISPIWLLTGNGDMYADLESEEPKGSYTVLSHNHVAINGSPSAESAKSADKKADSGVKKEDVFEAIRMLSDIFASGNQGVIALVISNLRHFSEVVKQK